jgi:hypothetical protein
MGTSNKIDQNETTIESNLRSIGILNRANIAAAPQAPLPTDLVWYAAYDQDMKKSGFEARMKEWAPEYQLDKMLAVQIKGWQVCFDTAISDAPFVRHYRVDSTNTMKMKLLKKDYSSPQSFVHSLLYLMQR